jgi:RNA polymerase sigma-70 factor (ECF subfamily)
MGVRLYVSLIQIKGVLMNKRYGDEKQLLESEIWDLFRLGDEFAFEYIYQKYFDGLYNYGRQFTRDHALVEDVLQELFIELKRRSEHLSPTNKIQPYLYSAFRRKIIRYRDKTSKFTELDVKHSFSITTNVEESLIEDERLRENRLRLQKAIENLSERHREIIFLFYYENLSYEEIREIQGFDQVKSARNLLYKALTALRKQILMLLILLGFWPFLLYEEIFVKKLPEL